MSLSTSSSRAGDSLYTDTFYFAQKEGSISSAQVVVPIVLSLINCDSVVDVGCGIGGWLKEFERNGVTDYLGVDGDYVSRDLLEIPRERFRALNLENLIDFGRRFDLACSLEVAEHLPKSCSRSFVSALVAAAPIVLFSAAIPRQGGTNHINEQWQSYWAALFAEHSYIAVDCVRPIIFGDRRIEWWYRQNIILFCEPDSCPTGCTPVTNPYYLDRADPEMLEYMAGRPYSRSEASDMLRRSVSMLSKAAVRKIKRTALTLRK